MQCVLSLIMSITQSMHLRHLKFDSLINNEPMNFANTIIKLKHSVLINQCITTYLCYCCIAEMMNTSVETSLSIEMTEADM